MAVVNSNKTLTVLEDSGVHTGNLVDDISYTISGYSISGEAGPFTIGASYVVSGKGSIQVNGNGGYSFQPVAHYNGVFPVVSFVVTDGVDSLTRTLNISVTSVSDAPVGGNRSIFFLEDSTYVFSASDFSISDVDGDVLKSVKIKSLPTKGVLKYGSANVSVNQIISAETIGSLKFVPAADEYGAPYTSFTFSVIDTGSTNNSGVIESTSDYTLTINVISVNDEPSEAEGGWVVGDFERILLVLEVGISEYTLNEMSVCANRLSQISSTLVGRVRTLLSEYDAAVVVQKSLGVSDDAGKVLTKADVLEWKVDKGGRYDAIMKEKGRIYNELVKIFSYCPILSHGLARNGTSLIRS